MVKLWKVEGWKRIEDEYEEALLWMEKLNLIGKSRPRTRRPAELRSSPAIDAHYTQQERQREPQRSPDADAGQVANRFLPAHWRVVPDSVGGRGLR
jgi:hypothetical protein